MSAMSLAVSLMACLGGAVVVEAFTRSYNHPHQWLRPITASASASTQLFMGGGFGASKAKAPSKRKPKKAKSKSAGILGELEVASALPSSDSASEAPKLDRFGLPLPTEEDVFPPLSSDIARTPAEYDADGYAFNREEVAHATKDHLGVNLDAFDENGQSTHEGGDKWSLELLHNDPPVFAIDNFFTPDECDHYTSMVNPANSEKEDGPPSAVQITSPTFSSHSISRRTSTTWFCRYEGVPTLLAKVKRLLDVELDQFEEPQIVRYRMGEEFSWHYDEIPSTQLANGGQRLATLLVYLNDMDEGRGGGTVFRDLEQPRVNGVKRSKRSKKQSGSYGNQLTVRPKTGTALLFFPSYKDGTPDVRTLHKGEVALDTKMIAQLWIHEREYRAGVPEGNLQADAVEGVREEEARLGF